MTERAAVVGLGDLGLAIASRLVECGVHAIGVDVSPERRAIWRERSGRDALAEDSRLDPGRVFVCVRMTEQAAEVLTELPGGVAYVVTTLEPGFARRLGGRAGLRVVELPVSGGRGAAERGELTVLAGGDQVQPDDLDFLHRTLARHVFTFPHYGHATLAKLLNNTIGAFNAYAFASCLELAAAAGLDASTCAEVVRASSGASWMAEHFAELVDDLLVKDAGLFAAAVGRLPELDLDASDDVLAALARARIRLSP